MNRFVTRLTVAAAGLMTAATLAGCGTGQISQTADQAPAVNGGEGSSGSVALRDVQILANQTGDSVPSGKTVDLMFVATNQSPDVADELTEISTDIGTVKVTGDKKLPAGGLLMVGNPADVARGLGEVQDVHAVKATVALDQPISSGVSYEFTFTFAKAGSIKLAVPVSAAEKPATAGAPAEHPGHH